MGETGTMHYRRSAHQSRAGRSDKDWRSGLISIPGTAQSLLMRAAAKIGQEGLLVLLVVYYLRPHEICAAYLENQQLIVQGFKQPIVIAEKHCALIDEWICRPVRPRQPATVYNILSGRLRQTLIQELESLQIHQNIPTLWRNEVRCGVRELRRLAEERFAVAANGDEAIFRELCHSYEASLAKTTYWRLTGLSRRCIENAFALEAREIGQLMEPASRSAIEQLATERSRAES